MAKIRPVTVPGERYQARIPDTLDLAERAKFALNVFTRNPDPKNCYTQWFGMRFCATPPFMRSPNFGCTMKFAEGFPLMRLMCGSDLNIDLERTMMETWASLIEDGLLYAPSGGDSWSSGVTGGTNGRMMTAMASWYHRDRDPAWKTRLRKMARGLDRIAVHRDNYVYFPPHGSWTKKSGWTKKDTQARYFSYHPPEEPMREQAGIDSVQYDQGSVLWGLMHSYAVTGDEKALELAGKVARFMLKPQLWEAGTPPDLFGREHGMFGGHLHSNVFAFRGILLYAAATGNKWMMEFIRQAYEYARKFGIARIGFIPTYIYPECYGQTRKFAIISEGCCIADMTVLAVELTDAGVGDYWEDVDQYVRNHLAETQFIDADRLREVSAAEPGEQIKNYKDFPHDTDNVIERCLGAYGAINGVSDIWACGMGCCTGNCNQALYHVWDGIVRYSDGAAQVNLLLNRASPWLDIDSYLPYEGKVVLKNKTSRKAYVRIPNWVDKAAVRSRINRKQAAPSWFGNYLVFEELKPEDTVTIEFPMVETTETYRQGDNNHTIQFKGNTVMDISPREYPVPGWPAPGGTMQIYLRKHYKRNKAPMKNTTRYVAPPTAKIC